ncbi:hypothetical protein [Streptomyces sp. NPDC006610]|uniref:hypothetical protein n=1 Tax=Streptomyces sp. NPDC006610 TaxID=3154584 RepID=UPI0033B0DE0E
MSEPTSDPALAEALSEAVSNAPAAPKAPQLDPNDPLTSLRQRVIETLQAMPSYFKFDTTIEGVDATDLQNANTLLGASIEVQVVATLNRLRELWDPKQEWQGYRFERQSQTFPDVRLIQRIGANTDIALGIELKGWYLFSKEGVPTFRFSSTPHSCADHDLLCVVPWHFSNVTSGTPVARDPWVVPAKWAAEYRNYWWMYIRRAKNGMVGITSPPNARPYPTKDQQISDVPDSDGGKNFGRLARVKGLMDTFIAEARSQDALGIPIRDWVTFFARHSDSSDADAVHAAIAEELSVHRARVSREKAERVASLIQEICDLLDSEE